jgi:LPS export ABC transporter protein LptC
MGKRTTLHKIKNIAAILLVAMFFSCGNDIQEINDFITEKNLPISITKNIKLIHTDSGFVKSKMQAVLFHDFSNRKKHPYNEFPEGIKIITFDGDDSTTVTANYAISYTKTQITEIKGNVVVINHLKGIKLKTEQLFWDQKENYYFTNKKAVLTTATDTLIGIDGFDAKSDLTNANMLDNSAKLNLKEE